MNEQEIAKRLSARELACLQYLAQHGESDAEHYAAVLGRLAILGLVEAVPVLALPVLPPRHHYRITARGRAVLHTARQPH
ncbi:MAG: hypothetical protein M3Z21_06180 [Pseudomonadota bacterium]|nr:hypothetical protein [Pseudomonadota bacterium]